MNEQGKGAERVDSVADLNARADRVRKVWEAGALWRVEPWDQAMRYEQWRNLSRPTVDWRTANFVWGGSA